MKTLWLACSLALGVAAAGCGGGMTKLDAKKVQHLQVELADRGYTYCPEDGLLPEVVAVVVYKDGRVLETWAPANPSGKLRATDLDWSTDVGFVEKNGVVDMTRDLLTWHDRVFVVRAGVPTRPELKAEKRITPKFDCKMVADASGLDGWAAGSGGDGMHGGAGPHVEVALSYVDTKLHGRIVLARVRDHELGRWEYYLVDRRAGQRLKIAADGGDGGDGGSGANGRVGNSGTAGAAGVTGGMCQNGQDGQPGGDGEHGGDGQPGGRGGNGGNGAAVTVRYPAAFPELIEALDISVEGGAPGAGGVGGTGGEGGAGGAGGSGGSAGPTSDPNQPCTTAAGSSGREGRKGEPGNPGSAGASGTAGARGTIETSPSSVRDLFAFELARGWALTLDDLTAQPAR